MVLAVEMWEEVLKTLTRTILTFSIIALLALSCGKDKAATPERPEDQGNAVTLQYQNYYYYQGYGWGCLRLTLDDNRMDLCGLGSRSASFWTRDYNWRLYIIDTRQQPETYIPVQQGTIHIDRNMTFVVNGNSVTWQ